jgi:hypothetical protein
MLLETSNTTSNFANRPHIKKGYYPGKLVKVKEFAGKDGVAKVCKHGKQLIMDFEVWKEDKSEPILVDGKPVVISKFIYHIYKVTDKEGTWTEGEFKTAITPSSAITKLLEALGWKFSENKVDPEEFIGNFVELNINDYEQNKGKEDAYISSSIADIGKLIDTDESAEPKEITPEIQAQIDKFEEARKNLDNLKESDGISEQGYADAIEQIDHDIKKLKN